jgi:uncharacterized caspase-like protein
MRVWAAVIGINDYTSMPKLNFAASDAQMVADFLRSPQGGAIPDNQIRVLLNKDANKANILNTLSDLYENAGPEDLVILYYSGHGTPGYFIPVDYDGTSNMIHHKAISTILLDSKAKYKLIIADACHSGSMTETFVTRSTAKREITINRYYDAFKNIKGGIALLLSSKPEEYSLESNGIKQGIFSHFVMEGLSGQADINRNKVIEIKELFEYVRSRVSETSGGFQNPILNGSFDENMPVGVMED